MMLDSSLGQISKNKTVEPSISNDNRLSPDKAEGATSAIKSEAEVRLVVRFFVEEHIVFNGKIEKVKQLESEELSRIVSRIAWDASKSSENPPVESSHVSADAIEDAPNLHLDSISSSTISDTNSTSANHPINQGMHQKPDKQENTNKSSAISFTNKSSRDNDLIHKEDEILVAQEKKEEKVRSGDLEVHRLESEKPCDKSSADLYTSNEEDEKNQKNEVNGDLSIELNAEIDNSGSTLLDKVEPQRVIERSIESDCLQDHSRGQNMLGENQTITETINDCVSRVESEIQKLSEVNMDSVSTSKLDVAYKRQLSPSDNFPTSPPNLSDSKQILEARNINNLGLYDESFERSFIEANIPAGDELKDYASKDTEQESCFMDIKIRSDQVICRNDNLDARLSPVKPENIGPQRRRNTVDNGPSVKRIRRSSTKDGRKSASSERQVERKDTKRASDRKASMRSKTLVPEQNSESISTSTNLTMAGTVDHLARSSKIFAKWTDNHFYPGTILRLSKDRKYTIGYYDGAQRNVAVTDLIPLCNILGKQVRVSLSGDYCVNAFVHDKKISSSESSPSFDVEYQQDGSVSRNCVPLKDIFLTAEQGATLMNQPIKPDKNPDESMFAGVDLDNIVHVKRSRRLQELEDQEPPEDPPTNQLGTSGNRRRRNHYNTRLTNNKSKVSAVTTDAGPTSHKPNRKTLTDVTTPDTPASSCSPDCNIKTNINHSNPPSESNSSTSVGSTNARNVLEMDQEFYFDSSSPHRTKTSLLL